MTHLTTRDRFNAFLDMPDVPVANAPTGPLAGLTLGVKDIFDVEGHVSGWGNPDRYDEGRRAAKTAPAVQKLLDAGARFIGKTQTEELAFSMLGQNEHFPHPVNPAAPDRVTGGSSSGSAAAVAGGLADIATGSDTGGSVRAPASFCGLIGLRTTHGLISLEGTMPLAPSFDTFGWFAKDAAIYEKVGEVLIGDGARSAPAAAPHPHPLPAGGEREASASSSVPEGMQKGTPAASLSPSSRGEDPAGGEGAGGEGHGKPRLLSLPALDELVAGPAEASAYGRLRNLVSGVLGSVRAARQPPFGIDDLYWSIRKLQAREAWDAHGEWISVEGRRIAQAIYDRFAFGRSVSDADVAEETARRGAFRAALGDLLGDDGVLVLPTVPCAAPRSDASPEAKGAFREQAIRLLCWSGLSGFPQITLPLGMVDGAPFGLSLLGPANSDMALIRLGRTILDATGKA